MAHALPTTPKACSERVEWMWRSDPDPWSSKEHAEWCHYSDVENLIIEKAFENKQPKANLDGYYIDLKKYLQISNSDHHKQRHVKRIVGKTEDAHLREARFMDLPTTTRSFAGQYGWISAFVVEVRQDMGLKIDELPSKKSTMIPMMVEKAANGIIEKGKYLQKEHEAKHMAEMLREKKNESMIEVWKCCAHLYSLESFLYKTLNAAMRLVGDKDHENEWKSKIRTLGPFCLLLWDDPINVQMKTDRMLYREAKLTPEQIAQYEKMAQNSKEYGSFPSFSSCSRNRQKAEKFGNVLFIMEVKYAFVADISKISKYQNEEEELITPGVCFRVEQVKFDPKKNKHFIHLQLFQCSSSELKAFFSKNFQNRDVIAVTLNNSVLLR